MPARAAVFKIQISKSRCMVEHIGLLTTVVRRRDGIKLWLPNARLAAEPLPNVSRSEKRWEGTQGVCSG